MSNSKTKPLRIAEIIIGILALFLITYILYPQWYQPLITMIDSAIGINMVPQDPIGINSSVLKELSVQAQEGDPTAVVSGVQHFLSDNRNISAADIFQANRILIDINLTMASSSRSRLDVYRSMIEVFDKQSTPVLQAWALNDLIVQITNTGDPALLLLISQDPILQSYVSATSTPQTVTNLAIYSYSIYPTAQAAYLAPTADEDKYVNAAFAKNLSGISATEKASSKENMISWLSQGDSLYSIEKQGTSTVALGYTYSSWLEIARGTLAGSLALLDNVYWQQADYTFQSTYNTYKTTFDANGNNIQLLITPAAVASLLDARFAYLLGPKTNSNRISSDLQNFASLVTTYPSVMSNYISWINQLQVVAQGKTVVTNAFGPEAWASMKYKYAMYQNFAALSPQFSSFLTSQGWNVGK
jgi:hypothetical protein